MFRASLGPALEYVMRYLILPPETSSEEGRISFLTPKSTLTSTGVRMVEVLFSRVPSGVEEITEAVLDRVSPEKSLRKVPLI
jgi:hypothetical protein